MSVPAPARALIGTARSPGRGIVAGLVAVAIALTSCGDDGGEPAAERTTTSTTVRDGTTTSTGPTTTTSAPAGGGSSTTTTDDIAPPPTFPPDRTTLSHGGTTWAVVLAAEADRDDPVLAEAVRDAARAGYQTEITDCDKGAAALFGSVEGYWTVSVYFEDEATARLAADVFATRHVSATPGQIETFCLD